MIDLLQKLLAFGSWEGYRLSCPGINYKEKPWFRVQRCYRMIKGDLACQVTVGYNKLRIVRLAVGKGAFGIMDIDGQIVAEVSTIAFFVMK